MTQSDSPLRVDSPCINLCVLGDDDVCRGCGRHIDEIAQWARMTAKQRHEANERADARREAQ